MSAGEWDVMSVLSVDCGVLKTLPGRSIRGLTDCRARGVLNRRELENGENTPLSSSGIPVPVLEWE